MMGAEVLIVWMLNLEGLHPWLLETIPVDLLPDRSGQAPRGPHDPLDEDRVRGPGPQEPGDIIEDEGEPQEPLPSPGDELDPND